MDFAVTPTKSLFDTFDVKAITSWVSCEDGFRINNGFTLATQLSSPHLYQLTPIGRVVRATVKYALGHKHICPAVICLSNAVVKHSTSRSVSFADMLILRGCTCCQFED